MKKLLTTVLVLTMIATVFCVSPVVYAEAAPTMAVVTAPQTDANDLITATFTNVTDARWVVYSIKDDTTGEYIFMDEKRGYTAQAEGFTFIFKPEEEEIKGHVDFVAEAKVTMADGTVVPLSQAFEFRSFDNVQGVIRAMLAGTKTITEAQAEINFRVPTYYSSDFNNAIITALNVTFADELAANGGVYANGDATTHIDQTELENAIKEESIINALNTNDTTVISNIVNNYPADIGIEAAIEYTDLYANGDKVAIITKLAAYDYATKVDFANQFKTENYLADLSTKMLGQVIDFLKINNNKYYKYDTTTTLTGGTLLNLNFDNAGGLTELISGSDTKAAYAEDYMAKGTYNSLADIDSRFTQLLIDLPSVSEPVVNTPENVPTIVVPSGGNNVGGSVSVGLVNPIVGQNSVPFTDIDDVDWAGEAIRALYREGVIDGVSAKQFQPNANVTREQFIKIIVNTFGLKGNGTATKLADVDQNEWYAPFINTAVELGIINGVSETEFGIGQNITRQDMAVIMYRVAKYIGKDITAKSSRVPTDMDTADDYADEAIIALYQSGIVNGVADGVFAGWQTATRAQAAKLCYDLRGAK